MAILTNINNYYKTVFQRSCEALSHNLGSGSSEHKTLEEKIEALKNICEMNGFATFDDIPKEAPVEDPVEAPKKKAKKQTKEEVNTPEAQEQMGQSVFKKVVKDNPNG